MDILSKIVKYAKSIIIHQMAAQCYDPNCSPNFAVDDVFLRATAYML